MSLAQVAREAEGALPLVAREAVVPPTCSRPGWIGL